MKILAIDLGSNHTGMAVSDKLGMLASPLPVVHETVFDKIVARVAETAMAENPERVIVGYPKHMNNTVGEMAQKCEKFAEKLQKKLQIPVILWDERMTTVSAINYLNMTDIRGKKRKAIIDSVAAVIILENYLSFLKNQKQQ